MKTKEELKKLKEQRKLELNNLKNKTKFEAQSLKIEEKRMSINERFKMLETRNVEPPEFNALNFIRDLVAQSSANNFSEIEWGNTKKEIVKIFQDNEFPLKFTRANYIASVKGVSGLFAFVAENGKDIIIEVGESINNEYFENELVHTVLNINASSMIKQAYETYEWKKENGVVMYRRFRGRTDDTILSQEEMDTEWTTTFYPRIPIILLPNNSNFSFDLQFSQQLVEYYAKTLEKIWDDMDFGGNKLAIEEDILSLRNGNETPQQVMGQLKDQFRSSVVMVPTKKIGLITRQNLGNQPAFEINSFPLNSTDLTKYLATIESLIWRASGLPEKTGKVGTVQETDTQISNANKLQNDSVEKKALIREEALKKFVRIVEMVFNEQEEFTPWNLGELDLEIVLSSNQQQLFGEGDNINEENKFESRTAPRSE